MSSEKRSPILHRAKNPRPPTKKKHHVENLNQLMMTPFKPLPRPWIAYVFAIVLCLTSIWYMHHTLLPASQRIFSSNVLPHPSTSAPELLQHCQHRQFSIHQIHRDKLFFFRPIEDAIGSNLPTGKIIDRRIYSNLENFKEGAILIYLIDGGHFEITINTLMASASLELFSCVEGHEDEEMILKAIEEVLESKPVEVFGSINQDLRTTHETDHQQVETSYDGDGDDRKSIPEFEDSFEDFVQKHSGRKDQDTIIHDFSPLPISSTPLNVCVNQDGVKCEMLQGVKIFYSSKSEVQLIEVFQRGDGISCLFIDRITQFCDAMDHLEYVRSLSEPVTDRAIKIAEGAGRQSKMAIIGGGDGQAARWVLDNYSRSVKSLIVVDLDPMVTEVTQQFFGPAKIEDFLLRDDRLKWNYMNPIRWIETLEPESLDGLIIQYDDRTNNLTEIYSANFYESVFKALKPGGKFTQRMNLASKDSNQSSQESIAQGWKNIGFLQRSRWKKDLSSTG